jgi:hypothetical protein
VLLSGCGGEEPNVRPVTSDGATALVQRADTGGGDAGIEGTLARTDAGCYGLRASPHGDGVVRVVIWPAGFDLADDGGLVASDGTRIAEGDHVTGGEEVVDDLASRYGDAVSDCGGATSEGFVMWIAEVS